jgi:hypothetical protein
VIETSVAATKKVLHKDVDFAFFDVHVNKRQDVRDCQNYRTEEVPFDFVSGSCQAELPFELHRAPFTRSLFDSEAFLRGSNCARVAGCRMTSLPWLILDLPVRLFSEASASTSSSMRMSPSRSRDSVMGRPAISRAAMTSQSKKSAEQSVRRYTLPISTRTRTTTNES